MRIFPNDDYVAVVLDNQESVTEGGIVLPQSVQRDPDVPLLGTVMCVGPGKQEGLDRIPTGFKAGERVLLTAFSGYNHVFENVLLRLVKASDILASFAE